MYFSQGDHPSPTFPDDVVQIFKNSLIEFFDQHGVLLDWHIRGHQPMHLLILKSFSDLMQDRDQTLFPALLDGVLTGFHHNIPKSTCMPINDREADQEVPLSAHYSNWNSAESDISLTQSLVQEEIDKGWVFEYDGTLEDAQAQWPMGVSLGKLGIAHSDGRGSRLVLDNTICGLNPRCWVPERSTLPTCKDILRTFPIREFQGDHMAFELDIKAAHKRIVLHGRTGVSWLYIERKVILLSCHPFWGCFQCPLVGSTGWISSSHISQINLVGPHWVAICG